MLEARRASLRESIRTAPELAALPRDQSDWSAVLASLPARLHPGRGRPKGGFDDFRIGVPPQELLGTVIRFVTSVVVAPFQRLFGESPPADGEETCRSAWREEKE